MVYREDSWKYGRGYYQPVKPTGYVTTNRGLALNLEYVGETPPATT